MLLIGATMCFIGSSLPLITLALEKDYAIYFVLTIGDFLSGIGSSFYKITFLILIAIFMKKKNMFLGAISVYFF